MASQIQANNLYHRRHFLVTLSNADYPFGTRTSLSISAAKPRTKPKLKPQKLSICSSLLSSSSSVSDKNPPDACEETNGADARTSDSQSIQKEKRMKKKRVFFLDVNALCYQGNTRSLHSFAHWIFLFFSQVSLSDPVIAVVDGERGNEYRKQILPSYKANRRRFSQHFSSLGRFPRNRIGRSHKLVLNVLHGCNVPVVKIEAHEADDVIATLVEQVISRGYQAVVASPDKDFRQLLSQDVQIVMPMPKCNRWSFYTLNHYIAQYTCDPQSDLSLRCFLGDEVDGVPGIQHFVPGFGRKTALKLLKKHGSLENLLSAAAVRTVGRAYAQDALMKYADHLRKNYQVLSLKRDVDVQIEDKWLSGRNCCNDLVVLSNFINLLRDTENHDGQSKYDPNG
ncbi:uncharacterized protein [Coffea arabica]|uniref:5'-3' exonuclease domain-containing protein n=1 Tax=Coffea arabica TaxID=13443 RepID=A0ABM4VVR6_COFAR|nr:uncharacterized protein LOC113712785 isoform X1 [Coffea arabica]